MKRILNYVQAAALGVLLFALASQVGATTIINPGDSGTELRVNSTTPTGTSIGTGDYLVTDVSSGNNMEFMWNAICNGPTCGVYYQIGLEPGSTGDLGSLLFDVTAGMSVNEGFYFAFASFHSYSLSNLPFIVTLDHAGNLENDLNTFLAPDHTVPITEVWSPIVGVSCGTASSPCTVNLTSGYFAGAPDNASPLRRNGQPELLGNTETATPEPDTLLLIGAPLLGLGLFKKRRR